MRLSAAIACAIASTLATSEAAASCPPIVSGCVDSDTMWPHAGPQLFMNVGGTETTEAERISFGLVATFMRRPITLQTNSPPGVSPTPLVDDALDVTFLFAYGLTSRLEFDL